MKSFLAGVFFAAFLTLSSGTDQLETIAQWPLLDFALPYDRGFLDNFRPENVVPTGIEIAWHRIFIATPRLWAGVPATLSFIPRDIPAGSSPQLQAYPSWDWHTAGRGEVNCSGLISVYRIRADKCNRLWVADSGVMTSLSDFTSTCPPKILVFDLHTDQLVRRIELSREAIRQNSLPTNLVIDDTAARTCDDVFVYLTDTTAPGIIVYDGAADKSWRVSHASMYPNPDHSMYQIGSDTFELFDGVVGLGFSPRQSTLYFQPLATDRLFSVPTSALQTGELPLGEQLPVTLVGRKSSQAMALAIDPRDDSILFSPLAETAIAAWQPKTNDQRILAYSPEQLQFTAEVRWAERDGGNVWALSSRFQKFFMRKIDSRDINIRIMRIRTQEEPAPVQLLPISANIYRQPHPIFGRNIHNNTFGF